MANTPRRRSNTPQRRSNASTPQTNPGGKAFNILGYGFGGLMIFVWIIVGLGLIVYGGTRVIRRVSIDDYHTVEAVRVSGGDFIYDDPVTGDGVDYQTDPSQPDQITLYIHKESGSVTETRPDADRSAGMTTLLVGVGFLLFSFFLWYLLRVSPTFRRFFGGVALLDTIF